MSDLTEFLLARIAEDEAWVRANWNSSTGLTDERWWRTPIQPSRLLAECEAKRKMVLELDGRMEHAPDGGVWFDFLTYLSWPYAAHPDHDEAWRA